ncbi:MAG: signal recognition particle-docking protein FtsY [Candidatus Pacearchaeota archaeon]|nr:signal recognition particle-docking protein FtsY [Candidatus Pacearchaeota archaeon]
MFKSLKNKLKGWLGKSEEKEEKPAKKPKEASKTIPKSKEKKSSLKKLPSDKELKKQAKKLKEIPLKFDSGKLKYEPEISEQTPSAKTQTLPEKESQIQESTQQDNSEDSPLIQKEKKSFFSRITSKFTTSTINQSQVDEILEPLELILLENNVALEVVDKIKEDISKDLVGLEVKKGKIEETITISLKQSIENVLINPPDLIEQIKKSLVPFKIIFFGINGSGKTTSVAKLAHKLKSQGISVVLAAADTFRAAAIQQLETHAKILKVPIIKHDYGSDPTSVAFDAVKYAEQHKIKVVLIDTAGRMYTKENLIKQMEKIIRIIKPNLKIFVGESIAGNDAIEQVKTFNEAVGIDGIILSKADVDEKGGTPLSVSYVTKKPIYFLGVGQDYKDLEIFKKEKILKNLGLD